VADLSFDGWLAAEERSGRRHELVGGRVYLMAGGTERHDLAAGLLYELVAPSARRRGCRPFTANRIVKVPSGSGYYPDVMVVRPPAAHRLYEDRPTLIIEVLSPSTADVERREKATAFASIVGLEMLLLVDPDVPRVEGARLVGGRVAGWDTFGPGDTVTTLFGELDLDALHAQIDATAST
jgi:Uma2 family endonuclease